MPIDFPNSPTNGDSYSAGGKTWIYNGTSWVLFGASAEIASGSVTTSKLTDSAVTTAKIADGAVTASKLGPGTGGGLDTDAEGAITIMDIGA